MLTANSVSTKKEARVFYILVVMTGLTFTEFRSIESAKERVYISG